MGKIICFIDFTVKRVFQNVKSILKLSPSEKTFDILEHSVDSNGIKAQSYIQRITERCCDDRKQSRKGEAPAGEKKENKT